jgi:alkylhydroperoxidase/carboxymuconolactone decarboxylase family protein YurZ
MTSARRDERPSPLGGERPVKHDSHTAEEVAEALGVAILMNGGPGTVHAPRAFAAYEEFAAKT